MKRAKPLILLLVLAGVGYATYYYLGRPPTADEMAPYVT